MAIASNAWNPNAYLAVGGWPCQVRAFSGIDLDTLDLAL